MYIRLFIFLIIATSILIVHNGCKKSALECPKPPEQVNKEWKVDVETAVAKIVPAKGAELKAEINRATHDLLGKYPNADRLYLEQMMFSAYCSALRDDKTLTITVKTDKLKEYGKELRESLQPGKSSKEEKSKVDYKTDSPSHIEQKTEGSQSPAVWSEPHRLDTKHL
jgi:hypothetical protein